MLKILRTRKFDMICQILSYTTPPGRHVTKLQAGRATSCELRAGILNNWELASCENLTKNVKFFWHELPSVEFHTYKFSRTSWNVLKIWNYMSNFEIHFENLTPVKELWYNRVRKEKIKRARNLTEKVKFSGRSFYERWMYGQGLMTAIIR